MDARAGGIFRIQLPAPPCEGDVPGRGKYADTDGRSARRTLFLLSVADAQCFGRRSVGLHGSRVRRNGHGAFVGTRRKGRGCYRGAGDQYRLPACPGRTRRTFCEGLRGRPDGGKPGRCPLFRGDAQGVRSQAGTPEADKVNL